MSIEPPTETTYSRRSLSLVTVLLLLLALGGGVAWRVMASRASTANTAEASAVLPEGFALPQGSGASQFSTDVPQPVGGAVVERDTLWIRVTAAGQAEAVMRAVVLAQIGGRIQDVPVRENAAVAEGAPLVLIDTTEFSLRVSQARANQQSAEVEFRQLTLFDDEIEDPAVREERRRIARTRSNLDQTEIELRQAELELERTRVMAPFEGRIADAKVVPGQYVSQGTELMTVVDLDPIRVEVQVLEAELGLLDEGRRAEVTFAAYPGEVFVGRVQSINPVVDPTSRTGRVTVLLANRDNRIKPGMYAEVSLDAEALSDRIMVPRAALLQRGTGVLRPMLFVYEESNGVGLAKWRYVNPGRENDTHVEILREGPEDGMVEPGEIVLVDGHHYLAHDTPVRLVDNVSVAGGRPSR
ncbi:MAG: efflux RND transporter periplasmic adaptor subunit [Gemmatimonadales bacterium]